MAAISTTPANVHQQGLCQVVQGLLGATMTASDACYLDPDGSWKLLDANDEHDDDVQIGVVLVGGASATYGQIVISGPMDIGGTLTNGMAYVAGTTGGDIHPVADFAGFSTAWEYHIGYATAADVLVVKPYKTGAEVV